MVLAFWVGEGVVMRFDGGTVRRGRERRSRLAEGHPTRRIPKTSAFITIMIELNTVITPEGEQKKGYWRLTGRPPSVGPGAR